MLLLNTNRKSYIGSPTAPSDLAFGDLEFEWYSRRSIHVPYIYIYWEYFNLDVT